MKEIRWDPEKNALLKRNRGVSFAQLIDSRLIGIEDHPTRPHQLLMIFEFRRKVWVVPYVEGSDHYFLKTAFPSRKHTKRYLKGTPDEENKA